MKRSASGTIVHSSPSEKVEVDKSLLEGLSKEELVNKCIQTNKEVDKLREELEKERRRGNFATLRLAVKEKLTAELTEEVELMRKSCAEEKKADRLMMDHFTGQVFQAMRDKLRQFKKEVKFLKMELDATKNGSESAGARKLAKRCEKLEEQCAASSASIQKISRLEILLAYANRTIDKLRRRQRDLNELYVDHDAEVAKLQSEVAHLKEENRRLVEGNELDRENLAASRLESASRASTNVLEHQEEADFDLVDNNADEMESVSSRELNEKKDREEKEGDVTPEKQEGEVVKVSSSGSEPDDAVVISSPESEDMDSATPCN